VLVLGISVFGHDSSCALVDASSGDILYALTEERFSNMKHDGGFPTASLTLLMEKVDSEKLGRVSHVALNIDPTISIERLKAELAYYLDTDSATLLIDEFDQLLPIAEIFHPEYFPLNYFETLLARRGIEPDVIAQTSGKISWYGNFALRYEKLKAYLQYKFPLAEIVSVSHHQCHAASAFYCSDFENAAVLTVDGQGEDETITLNMARGAEIRLLSQTRWPNSLGALYMQLAWYLGFDGDSRYPGFGDEYKVMGMAAYGKPIYVDIFREMGRVSEKGEFELVFGEYLEIVPVEGCPGHFQPLLSKQFFNVLGERRLHYEPIEQRHYDIARSGQTFLEDIGVAIAKHLKMQCPDTDNLCVAGGVGLNGLMNMRILREAGFRRIFVQPASGDDGTSLGAALHVYHDLLKGKRSKSLDNAYLGFDYENHAIHSALEKYNLKFHEPESIHAEMGRLLQEGNIIARYFGRGEFGPRALGHRSILANPTLPEMKDAVNAKIKHRESFRPFAPACLEERVSEYFDIDIPAPYMLLICQARPGVRSLIPAVVHDDGTARVQTVRSDQNPDFYQTISEFNKLSGVPVLLNTSFNVNGEAIVETPQDAVESFLFMGIDYLAIGPYLVSKTENEAMYRRPTREAHIQDRQDRYVERFFSREMFLWSTGNPVETDLVLLKKQVAIYKNAAEDRLAVIEQLDTEVQRLSKIQANTTSQLNSEEN
jgi:carbamoyltransferase